MKKKAMNSKKSILNFIAIFLLTMGFLLQISESKASLRGELSPDSQLSFSFQPLSGNFTGVNYEVICRFRDPKNSDNFPYINNFIKIDKLQSTKSVLVGTVDLKRQLALYGGADMYCSVQYRAFLNNKITGGELASLEAISIPSRPLIVQPLTKINSGFYRLIFRYEFKQETTQQFYSLQCQNLKESVQYNFESNSKHLDEHQVQLDLRSLMTSNYKNIKSCYLIARFNYRGGYQSELIGYIGKLNP